MVGQDHWGCQLHKGYVIVECLWVELQEVEKACQIFDRLDGRGVCEEHLT